VGSQKSEVGENKLEKAGEIPLGGIKGASDGKPEVQVCL